MHILCIGDLAIANEISSFWLPPAGITPGDEARILFNWELPIGRAINQFPRTSGPRLLSHPNSVNIIQKWAPGFAALATNHILDGGTEGLAATITALKQAGFQTVGAGFSMDEIEQPLFWETNEGRLAIVNWVFPETHPDWMAVPGPNCWPGVEEARLKIQELRHKSNWILIVTHWSNENFAYPRPEDREIAHEMVQMGADIIIGHHPHVVRGMETIGHSPIYYSIGNFHLPDYSEKYEGWILQQAPRNREGLGVQISFKRGRKPEYRIHSFWQMKREVVVDPIQRANQRMKQVSRSLQQYQDTDYEEWYTRKHAQFDKWEAKWHFSIRRLGIRGVIRYVLNKSLANSSKKLNQVQEKRGKHE
jgi:hypothetical protein